MFHRIHRAGGRAYGQGSITDKEFVEILHYIGLENILPPDEWLYKLKGQELKKNELCLTFDDGLKCQYKVGFPILEDYNIRAFWFIYSSVFEDGVEKIEIYSYFMTRYFSNIDDFFDSFFEKCNEENIVIKKDEPFQRFYDICTLKFPFYSVNDIKFRYLRDHILNKNSFEKIMDELINENGATLTELSKKLWMNDSDLRNLALKGHHIGLHSYNHPTVISNLTFDDQCYQYKSNHEHIDQVCNQKISSMAHPCGDYNDDTLRILKELDVTCGFRSNMTPPEGGQINQSPFECAREDCANIIKNMKTLF